MHSHKVWQLTARGFLSQGGDSTLFGSSGVGRTSLMGLLGQVLGLFGSMTGLSMEGDLVPSLDLVLLSPLPRDPLCLGLSKEFVCPPCVTGTRGGGMSDALLCSLGLGFSVRGVRASPDSTLPRISRNETQLEKRQRKSYLKLPCDTMGIQNILS